MRKIILGLLISVSLISIIGCTKNYDRNDIINYVNEELKIMDIQVSKTYKEIIDEEGYTDKIWTVLDKENNITFHVLDDFYYGMESVTNHLSNDYDESAFIELYNEMDVKQNIVYNYKSNNLFNEVNLICNYNNKKELNECYTSLLYYKNYIESKNFDLAISYTLEYDFSLKIIGEYESNLGTTAGQLNNLDQNVLNEAMYDYLSTALMLQIDSGLNEITEENMKQILENDETHLIFIKKDGAIEQQYDDIIAHPHAYGISFGTLYKILKKEGFNPDGNSWHYTVVNKNGDKFEFSYDFNDYVYENGMAGYYYKKNDEKISMGAYFYNCFKDTQINEMFGINIEDKQKNFLYN